TVTDAAKLLSVLAGYDPADPATIACLTPGRCHKDYAPFLNKHALKGARIAVPHLRYWTNASGQTVISAEIQKVMNDAIAVLRAQGAIVDDPADIPDAQELNNVGTCVVSPPFPTDRKSTRLNSSHRTISYAVFCLKKKKNVQSSHEYK